MLLGYFCVVTAQPRPKVRALLCNASCQDPRHDTTLSFVLCLHGLKFIVSCHVSDRAKMLCFVRPTNNTTQIQLYLPLLVHVVHQECTSDHQVSNSNELVC
jgi:hypothetical protein